MYTLEEQRELHSDILHLLAVKYNTTIPKVNNLVWWNIELIIRVMNADLKWKELKILTIKRN